MQKGQQNGSEHQRMWKISHYFTHMHFFFYSCLRIQPALCNGILQFV